MVIKYRCESYSLSVSGNTVTVKSIGAGSATITVKSASNTNYNEKTAAYAVTVKFNFTESSGVGYYADVDGNGTVDGIFADFKLGGSGSWGRNIIYNTYSHRLKKNIM